MKSEAKSNMNFNRDKAKILFLCPKPSFLDTRQGTPIARASLGNTAVQMLGPRWPKAPHERSVTEAGCGLPAGALLLTQAGAGSGICLQSRIFQMFPSSPPASARSQGSAVCTPGSHQAEPGHCPPPDLEPGPGGVKAGLCNRRAPSGKQAEF